MIILFILLILLSIYDIKYYAVPDYLLIFLVLSSFLIDNFNYFYGFFFSGIGVVLELFVTFYINKIRKKNIDKSLGEGDLIIFFIIGGLFEIDGFRVFLISSIVALLFILFYKLEKLPFIPFLSFGIVVLFLNNYFSII